MARALRPTLLVLAFSFVQGCSGDPMTTDLGGSGGASDGSSGSGGSPVGTGGGGSSGGATSGSGGGTSGSGGLTTGGNTATGGSATGGSATGGGSSSGGADATGGGNGSGGGEPIDCTFVPDPDLAEGESGPTVGATAAHNEWRVRAGVPPMRWNQALADGAQGYADTCPTGHSSSQYRQNVAGFSQVGENLYSGTDVLHGIELFADERLLYEFGTVITEDNFSPIGHYTQMVWSDTTDVGCAVGNCGTWRTVCWYGPAGNYLNEAPYGNSDGACLDLDNDDVFQFEDADDTNREVQ